MNIYLKLTEAFNNGRLRTIVCSGQAVVLHRLAIMSKDGDWILREDEEAVNHVIGVLADLGAVYRFGAPMDLRWLRGGWSSHLEFSQDSLRVRTDFFTRPPRLSAETLREMWNSQEGRNPAFVGLRELAELKKTNREKDYAVIGELARRLPTLEEQLQYSRSARDLLQMMERNPVAWRQATAVREALRAGVAGREALEAALDRERRQLMQANEFRLERYEKAAATWAAAWPQVFRQNRDLPLRAAHENLVKAAEEHLPYEP
jgi:hypothetical protein